MEKLMKAVKLFLDWQPRESYRLGSRDIKGKRAQEGNKVWRKPRVELSRCPIPKVGPTQILIKVEYCGICGSDVLMADSDEAGYTRYGYIMRNGVIIGHEFSGEIVEMGKKIKEFQKKTGREIFKIGTPVTAQCVINCGLCEKCKEGKFDECWLNEERGFSIDGAMAEYAVADIRHVYSLEPLQERYQGKELFLAGSLIEPLAGAYKALFEVAGGLSPGDNAVVIGGGPIGLSGVALLKAAGAAKVILFEPSSRRREIGRSLRADYVFDPREVNFKEVVLEVTGGVGAKLYFEAAGVAARVYLDIDALFKTGEAGSKFVFMGHGEDKITISTETLIGGYDALVGSHGHSGIWRNVIRMVGAGLIDPRKMITREITMEQVPQWLEVLRTDKKEGKVVIIL
jgi:threonine dehydrogenase-like Zn-dependent dehydrogenase